MSRYDWESGTLKFTSAAFPAFRKALAAAYNDFQARRHACAMQLHEAMVAAKKKAPRGKFEPFVWVRGPECRKLDLERRHNLDVEDIDQVFEDSMTVPGEDRWPDRKKFRRPQKKDFPLAVATKTTEYSWRSESGVHLDLKARTLMWSVSENNHACERAHDHPMSLWLFQALRQVDWGRSGGGVIVGNDEYNRDDRETGGGGNYITHVFGPAGRKEQEWATGVKAGRNLGAVRRSRF